MKNPTYKGKELLPLSVIDAARDGDSQAVDRVLRYYEGYINKLCTRTLYNPDGQQLTLSLFPLFRGRRQHLDKESPLGDQRRSIRQTDTFLFVPSHTVGAP